MTHKIEQAYLNGAVLTLLATPVNQSFKDDALDCGLYVQLAASKQFDRFTHFQDWQTILIKALTAFGWVRLDFANQQQPISESIVVANLMREALSESLGSVGEEQLDQVFATRLTGLCAEASKAVVENSVQISRHHDVSSVVLQLALLLPSRQMALLCMAFETREIIGPNPFTQSLAKGSLIGDLKSFAFVGTLDDLRYTAYRQRISEALDDRRSGLRFAVRGAVT